MNKESKSIPFSVPFVITTLILITDPSGTIGIIAGISWCVIVISWIISYNAQNKNHKRSDTSFASSKNERFEKSKVSGTLKEKEKYICFQKEELEEIGRAISEFIGFSNFQHGYFTYKQHQSWKNQYSDIYDKIKENISNNNNLDSGGLEIVDRFKRIYSDSEISRSKINHKFIMRELNNYSRFFEKIESKKLDIQQRKAIVIDEDNNLIIAGAGTGKTTTIVGKTKYLIDRYKIDPKEILLISFTNKSASTLADRIKIDGIEVKTFHKYGKDVIAEVEGKQPSIFDENQLRTQLRKNFSHLLCVEKYKSKLTDYFSNYLKPVKSMFDFKTHGEYIQYLKDNNIRPYKLHKILVDKRITYKREIVKSIEECKIANYLLFNNLDYEYERPYDHDTATRNYRQYKPDFTVIQNGKRVYIEHFALSKAGNVPKFFAKPHESIFSATKRYLEKIHWAEETHKEYGTTLIKTFSYEMDESNLFENLTKKLMQAGIVLRPKTYEEKWQIINESAKDEVESFLTLIQTFLTLMKSNSYKLEDIGNKIEGISDKYQKERSLFFIELFKPVYNQYQAWLDEKKEIDFSDMINKATNYLEKRYFIQKCKYLIIDEFQDISVGRYLLIRAIINQNPECKLFCVGDDWQSIYRFTGSDGALFKEFEKYFGFCEKSKIETTYRFNEPLITLSSNFIQRNPFQENKKLVGITKGKKTTYEIRYYSSEDQDEISSLEKVFSDIIISTEKQANKDILILGRYWADLERIGGGNKTIQIDKDKGEVHYTEKNSNEEGKSLNARFLTIHRAKGLEADIVIVLNCNSGKYGIPCEMSDDDVLKLLLCEEDKFPNGEERRVFYVAMTRAKEHVYFLSNEMSKSKFIIELEKDTNNLSINKCPKCVTADLVLKKGVTDGKDWSFWGCSNYSFGCDYQKWLN
jgi:DNA helicase-4